MPRLSKTNKRSRRVGATTKYDAHHTVLDKTYGALADLRRELADSKSLVAEREELLRVQLQRDILKKTLGILSEPSGKGLRG
jgi:hypothetical protein